MSIKNQNAGILEIDIHGMTAYQAKTYIDNQLKRSNKSIYRIRVIHGYHNGKVLKDTIQQDYRKHPKVIRLEYGINEGITDLVLREL